MKEPAPVRPAGHPTLGARAAARGVDYRVWAPEHDRVEVVLEGPAERAQELARDAEGYFFGHDPEGRAGDRYRFRLDGATLVPDPASRFQPEGVFGPSEVVSPRAYAWRHPTWRRPPLRGRVLYELHVGAFTAEGTYAAAAGRLPWLAALGVDTIQLMPLADFPGGRNWGYDGVFLYAPARCYGRPDDLRALVDTAHGLGLAVVLDVVYNHLGPVGNTLPALTRRYFHPERKNGWGDSLNFDGPHAAPVRDFFLQNAAYWLDEYRFDGLRLDAVHAIHDDSPRHLLAELAAVARARGAFVIGEDDRNLARVVTPAAAGGLGLDAVWADDLHHHLRVALTGEREAHFASFEGSVAALADTLAHGWYYRGQLFPRWDRARGTPTGAVPPEAMVVCLSNHDQVGNRPFGERLHAVVSPGAYRAASLLLCLAPGTPMLFMGQEWAASTPFLYFCEHPDEIGQKVAEGRAREFAAHFSAAGQDPRRTIPSPQADRTFLASKLRWDETGAPPHASVAALYRDALQLRRAHWVFQSAPREHWRAWAASDAVLALRWFDPAGDWLLLVTLAPAAPAMRLPSDTALAPPAGRRWALRLDTQAPGYAGPDEPGRDVARAAAEAFVLPAPGAALFRAE